MLGAVAAVLGGGKLISGLAGARSEARGYRQDAIEMRAQAQVEELNAKFTENDLRESLVRTLASNAAAASASGAAGGSGILTAPMFDDVARAYRAIGRRNLEATLKAGALRRGAKGADRAASDAQIFGSLDAILGAAQTGANIYTAGGGK